MSELLEFIFVSSKVLLVVVSFDVSCVVASLVLFIASEVFVVEVLDNSDLLFDIHFVIKIMHNVIIIKKKIIVVYLLVYFFSFLFLSFLEKFFLFPFIFNYLILINYLVLGR
ncbi:MAG: hypothetical protein M1326_01370 [Cyanobacteria bacterium]|nr:hypothetical protein [Cyanobacteriota bacterium]